MSAKPTYNALVVEAIASLKERTGSSLAAIKKAIASQHPDFKLQAVRLFECIPLTS
jgi:translation elongation factor EF-Ts